GPYLPQSTIDVIRQWITDGAADVSQTTGLARLMREGSAESLAVTFTAPEDGATVAAPVRQLVAAFNHELDATRIDTTTVVLERLTPDPQDGVTSQTVVATPSLALGNPH